MSDTIFVSIASYRDSEMPLTVKSLIENAAHPENLHIGVVQQSTKRERVDLSVYPNVSEIWMRPQDARGAGFARARAQEMFKGEDFFLQIDSHTRMAKNWDIELIDILQNSAILAGTDKVILSQFPKPYGKEGDKDINVFDPKYPWEPHRQRVMWAKHRVFSAKRMPFLDQAFANPEESHTVLAGFIFAPGRLINEIPYDPDISFFGEELCFAIRAWTRGWRFYSPNRMLVSHFYKRPHHHKIWDAGNNSDKKWGMLEKRSMDRQAAVYNGDILGLWGASSIDKLNEFQEFVGMPIADLYNTMLEDRGMRAKTWKEAEIDINGFGPSLSIPCMDSEHAGCMVKGCECPCHG